METQSTNFCACCAVKFDENDFYCNSCGYPLQGSEEEQKNHIANRSIKEIDLEDFHKNIKSATNSLYWVAGLFALGGLITTFQLPNSEDIAAHLITYVILISAFLALAVWGKQKPLPAIISGLSLYVIIQIVNAIFDPITILSGIILKIIIIVCLIKGIKAALEADKIKKELNIS